MLILLTWFTEGLHQRWLTWKIPAQFFPGFNFKALLFGCSAHLGLFFFTVYISLNLSISFQMIMAEASHLSEIWCLCFTTEVETFTSMNMFQCFAFLVCILKPWQRFHGYQLIAVGTFSWDLNACQQNDYLWKISLNRLDLFGLSVSLMQLLLKFKQHLGAELYQGHFSTTKPSSGLEPLQVNTA